MAGLVRSAADQEMRRCLRDAERALRRAADLCGRVVQANHKAEKERSVSRQALHTQRDLEQILGRIAAIGHIAPLGGEPDLTPEAERNRLNREAPAKKRAAKHPLKARTDYGTEE